MQAMRAAARVALRRRTITTTAAVCTELGAPLTVRDDWKIEEPGPGEVLVETRAAGLNFAEVLQTKGLYQERLEPPFVPGNECSGTVEAVGAGVSHVKAGDAVMFDYRVLHRGGANSSTRQRPLLYFTYARPWFTDATNYSAVSLDD